MTTPPLDFQPRDVLINSIRVTYLSSRMYSIRTVRASITQLHLTCRICEYASSISPLGCTDATDGEDGGGEDDDGENGGGEDDDGEDGEDRIVNADQCITELWIIMQQAMKSKNFDMKGIVVITQKKCV